MPATAAQSSQAPIFDGHDHLIGVFGGAPDSVPGGYAHSAINRFFREDENRTRPSIRSLTSHFDTEADRIWFEGGNGQGMFFYNSYPSTLNPRIIVSISGKIFAGTVLGRDCYWTVIADGNSRVMCNTWFAQGFEWLFIQDGIHQPIFWDGVNPSKRSDPTKGQMPIGSVMAYIHGRMVVASADGKNTISVGDIVYGDGNTTTADLLDFTEQEYWAEGGSFDTAAPLGDIYGLYAMPWLDTGTGANELVALCAQGFTSFDLSQDRSTWLDQQVQKISMIGQGCVSSIGFSGLNGDLFYRRPDGIGSYRNARTQFTRQWNAAPVSREVNHWLKHDRSDLLKFIPMVSWQNMVITGISPQIQAPNNPCAGYHRYCRAVVVFDAQTSSTTSRDGAPVWHGAWTGIRPWGFAQGYVASADRCFAMSFDRDGRNRLYEYTLDDGEDLFGREPRKQFWRYDTAALGQVEARCSFFELKQVTGGQLVLSGIKGQGSFNVQSRPDGAPCMVQMSGADVGCDCVTPTTGEPCTQYGSQPQWGNFFLQAPTKYGGAACVPGTTQAASAIHYMQARVSGYGPIQVERLAIRMLKKDEDEVAKCYGPNCEPVDCCADEADFAYHIAPAGTNTEIPNIPCPVPPVVHFTSTRFFTLFCPGYPAIFVTGKGQAESGISQLDADTKAIQAAQANAQQLLDESACPHCETQVVTAFEANGGATDLSEYFVPGRFPTCINQPWRLIDAVTDALIATGYINPAGTMTISIVDWGYPFGSLDADTKIYQDNGGGGPTLINLQIGCNVGGNVTWPEDQGYGY